MGEGMLEKTLRKIGIIPLATATVLTGPSCGGEDATAPTTGSVEITTATSGHSPDADGYTLTVDGTLQGTIAPNAEITLDGLTPGGYAVALSGIAANCQVQGDNPQSVSVIAGATTTVAFTVVCTTTAAIGSIEITTTTAGGLPDPDGYSVTLDAGTAQAIGANTTLIVPAVSPGTHQVTLGGLATNCHVDGDNPRSVVVTAGATATVAFTIACSAPSTSKIAWAKGNPDLTTTQHWDIYVMNPDGSGQTQLTLFGGHYEYQWSPDGSRIAFAKGRFHDGSSEIYVMNADGSEQTQLTHGFDRDPQWSPDGSKLAFYRDEESIYLMKADGTGETALTGNVSEGYSWSPDGTKIAFVKGSAEIWVINSDGSGEKQLTRRLVDHGQRLAKPVWSPDGGRIAFHGRDSDIYVMNPDGSNQTNLTNTPEWVEVGPVWSPDGRKLAYRRSQSDPYHSDIYVMNADGSNQVNLTNSPSAEWDPAWSADGNKIAFSRDEIPTMTDNIQREIWVMNADGTQPVQLTNDPENDDFNPRWSP